MILKLSLEQNSKDCFKEDLEYDYDLELVLVRHGTTLWNRERRYLGHSDPGLLPGVEQELAPLQKHLRGRSFARIYCSDLLRCRQTLHIVLPEPERTSLTIIEPRLRELHFGDWDGKTYEMLKDVALYRAWIDEPQRITPPGGEPWAAFVNRLREFLDSLYDWCTTLGDQKAGTPDAPPSVLAVTHGGVLRQLACMLVPGHDFWSLHPKPGAAITMRLRLAEKPSTGRQPTEVQLAELTTAWPTESRPDLHTGRTLTGWLAEQT